MPKPKPPEGLRYLAGFTRDEWEAAYSFLGPSLAADEVRAIVDELFAFSPSSGEPSFMVSPEQLYALAMASEHASTRVRDVLSGCRPEERARLWGREPRLREFVKQ